MDVGAEGFLAACFFAAAGFGSAAAGGGGGAAGLGAAAAGAAARPGFVPGSGVMMLTGGVEAALGKSALVGRPVGNDGGSMATAPVAAGGGGEFHAMA